MLFAGAAILIGAQLISFGIIASLFGARENYWLSNRRLDSIRRFLTVDNGCIVGGLMILLGAIGAVAAFVSWARADYGDVWGESLMRIVIPSVIFAALGVQLVFTTFLIALLSHPPRLMRWSD